MGRIEAAPSLPSDRPMGSQGFGAAWRSLEFAGTYRLPLGKELLHRPEESHLPS
jgi:hypothetical protein